MHTHMHTYVCAYTYVHTYIHSYIYTSGVQIIGLADKLSTDKLIFTLLIISTTYKY